MNGPNQGLLEGTRVVISGSSRGLGGAYAVALAAAGADVVINGRDKAAVDSTLARIAASGGRAESVVGSVADDDVCRTMVERCVDCFGGIDVAIANAGILRPRPLLDSDPRDFDDLMAVNLRGAWSLGRHAARAMRSTGGSIILVGSAAGFVGSSDLYSASKAAIFGLLCAWTPELAPHGIRVNVVAGTALTDMTAPTVNEAARTAVAEGRPAPSAADLGFGAADDVAALIVYLCSDAAKAVRGQFIRFNGSRLVLWQHPAEGRTAVRERWTQADLTRDFPTPGYPMATLQ